MQLEDFEAHAVWTTLDALHEVLKHDLEPNDTDERYAVRRLHSVAEFTDALRDTDPVLVEPSALQELNNNLTQLLNHLRNYLTDPEANKAHLPAASQAVANIINSVRQHFPTVTANEANRAMKAASTRYRNSLDAEVERLIAVVVELEQQLVNTQEQRLGDQSGAEEKLSALDQTIRRSEASVGKLEARLQQQIDSQRTAFEQEATQRAIAYKETDRARDDAESSRVEAAKEKAQDVYEVQQEKAQGLLEQLRNYNSQAAALVDTTSRHAIAGDYGTWSANQAKAAFIWTVVAVIIGSLTAVGLIYAVGSAADDSVQFTVYKTSISIIGLIVAGYCARQAGEHRREERTAKRLALDLAALEPFLERLEEPGELRAEFARRVFAPENSPGAEVETKIKSRHGLMSVEELAQLVAAFRQ